MSRALGVPHRVAELVIERDASSCIARITHLGVAKPYAHLHHRRPRKMGGSREAETNMPANLICLCEPCHAWIESHRTDALMSGWLVATRDHPHLVPLLYRDHWVYLLNDGQVTKYAVPPPWED